MRREDRSSAASSARLRWPPPRCPPPASPLPAGIQRPLGDLVLSEGRGQLVNLPAPMSDIFVSNDKVADVQVRSPTQLYVFAKTKGEATVFAITKGGQVVYSTNVRVGSNSNSLDQMLRLALPDAAIVRARR